MSVELLLLFKCTIHGLTSIVADFIFRVGIMYMSNDGELGQQMRSNMFSSGSGFFVALRLLSAFSSKLSSDVNRPFGDEKCFTYYAVLCCSKASEEVGAQLLLGHRPIEITLERAWNSLKWNEKLSLVLAVVRGITSLADMSRNNLKESSTDDSTIQLYEQLSFSYPSLQQPLFNERDTDNSVDFLHQNSLTTHQPVAASSSSTGLSVNP
ncbi:hypothetical protein HYC85_007179 [Camellia sinensis]|uniref:Uncharacterized protein n=1 Tax=Camellia sinensis TaxID=4442 RepID=A0A7J7HN80_CAMSI|nr:hypothetical protein HYC85_007179 [Camellia sinensis]